MIKKSLKTILFGTLIGAFGLGAGIIGTYKMIERPETNVIYEMKKRVYEERDYIIQEQCVKQKAKKTGAKLIGENEIRKVL